MSDHAEKIEMAKQVLGLSEKATSGPWRSWTNRFSDLPGRVTISGPKSEGIAEIVGHVGQPREADGAVVAGYRTSAPQLAQAVIEMAAEIERLKGCASDHVPTPEQLDESWDETDDRIVDLIREARRRERVWIGEQIAGIDPSECSARPEHYALALHDVRVILRMRDQDQARPKPATAQPDDLPIPPFAPPPLPAGR